MSASNHTMVPDQNALIRKKSSEIADALFFGKTPNGKKISPVKTVEDIWRCAISSRATSDEHSYNALAGKSGHELSQIFAKQLSYDTRAAQYQFSSIGQIAIGDYNAQLIGVVQEFYGQNLFEPTLLDQILPDASTTAQKIYVDVYAAPGGLIDAHTYGSPVKEQPKLANRTFSYTGTPYRNYIKFSEYDILYFRELGNSNVDARGITQRMTYNILKAKTQLWNRKQQIKATIFDGSVTVSPDGGPEYTVSYQIPTWNVVTSAFGQQWATYNTTTGQWIHNTNADPIADLFYYLNIYEPWYTRRYQLNSCRLGMGPILEQIFLTHPNVRNKLYALQTSPGSVVPVQGTYTVDNVVKSLLPGFTGEVIIEGAGYLTEDSSASWVGQNFGMNAPGQQFFLPPNIMMFAINPPDMPLGQFVYQPALQNGGMENPQGGEWIISQSLIGPGFPQGLTDPNIQIQYGQQGGVACYHPESMLFGNFITLTS